MDGFDIQAWSAFARHKSRIVSDMCRVNGRLKAELNAQVEATVSGARAEHPSMIWDTTNDPWASACLPPPRRSGAQKPHIDPWSSRRPCAHDADVARDRSTAPRWQQCGLKPSEQAIDHKHVELNAQPVPLLQVQETKQRCRTRGNRACRTGTL